LPRDFGSGELGRAFHDYVWKNGNVPMALLRWELLGLTDEVELLSVTESLSDVDYVD
jgi:hypothetical protein